MWRQAYNDMLQKIGATNFQIAFGLSVWLTTFVASVGNGLWSAPRWTMAAVTTALKAAFFPVALAVVVTILCWMLVYLGFFIRAAQRSKSENGLLLKRVTDLEARTSCGDRRIQSLLRHVPRLSSSQTETLAGDLKRATMRDDKRGTVFIRYVDTPTSGAQQLAYQIEVAFDRAGWRIERQGVSTDGYENTEGLMMFIEKVNEPTPRQRDVIAALTAAGFSVGYFPGANVTDDRVEFVVGNL